MGMLLTADQLPVPHTLTFVVVERPWDGVRIEVAPPAPQALLQKLWVHESRRVFTDRLVCEADELVVEGLLELDGNERSVFVSGK